jgi:AcrR family transcriptional regulator
MKDATPAKGRPRAEDSRQKILDAAFSLIVASGYDSMTVEAVARTAQVGKSTIYRWWRNRAHLAIEAFYTVTSETIEFPDTGSIEQDFRIQVHRLGDLLRQPEGRALLNMVVGAKNDPNLRQELFQSWIKPRKVWGEERMRQLAPPNVSVALNSLYGPLYATLLFGLEPLTAAEIDLHLDHFFRGLLPNSAAT